MRTDGRGSARPSMSSQMNSPKPHRRAGGTDTPPRTRRPVPKCGVNVVVNTHNQHSNAGLSDTTPRPRRTPSAPTWRSAVRPRVRDSVDSDTHLGHAAVGGWRAGTAASVLDEGGGDGSLGICCSNQPRDDGRDLGGVSRPRWQSASARPATFTRSSQVVGGDRWSSSDEEWIARWDQGKNERAVLIASYGLVQCTTLTSTT